MQYSSLSGALSCVHNRYQKSAVVLAAGVLATFTLPSHAEFIGVLPATPGGTDYQAYYDTLLDISWTTNANINGPDSWENQMAWADSLVIGNARLWRLADMNTNGVLPPAQCTDTNFRDNCDSNEYEHLYDYGADETFGSNGITLENPDPFINLQGTITDPFTPARYWSSTEIPNTNTAYVFDFGLGFGSVAVRADSNYAWAVHNGNVGLLAPVPVPAAVWLFGSGLLGLIGVARRKKAT